MMDAALAQEFKKLRGETELESLEDATRRRREHSLRASVGSINQYLTAMLRNECVFLREGLTGEEWIFCKKLVENVLGAVRVVAGGDRKLYIDARPDMMRQGSRDVRYGLPRGSPSFILNQVCDIPSEIVRAATGAGMMAAMQVPNLVLDHLPLAARIQLFQKARIEFCDVCLGKCSESSDDDSMDFAVCTCTFEEDCVHAANRVIAFMNKRMKPEFRIEGLWTSGIPTETPTSLQMSAQTNVAYFIPEAYRAIRNLRKTKN